MRSGALCTKSLANKAAASFMANRSGDLINKCTGDVDAINNFVSWISFSIFDSVVMLVVVLIVFFSISWKFTVLELCLAPIALFALRPFA